MIGVGWSLRRGYLETEECTGGFRTFHRGLPVQDGRKLTGAGVAMMQSSLIGRVARSENLRGWAMVSPTALVAILLLAAPLGMIVAFSFMTDGYLEILPEFTLENYTKA